MAGLFRIWDLFGHPMLERYCSAWPPIANHSRQWPTMAGRLRTWDLSSHPMLERYCPAEQSSVMAPCPSSPLGQEMAGEEQEGRRVQGRRVEEGAGHVCLLAWQAMSPPLQS